MGTIFTFKAISEPLAACSHPAFCTRVAHDSAQDYNLH
jgi:hypothetical protein